MRDFVQQIYDIGPTATPLMEQINGESEELLGLVQNLQTNITEKQSSVEELRGRVTERMTALRGKVEEQQALIEKELADCDAKTEEMKQALEQIKESVTTALETAQEQMDDFREHVDAGRELVLAANEAAQGVVQEVTGHVENGRQLLHEATDFANARVDDFQGKIDETFELTEQVASNLIEQVDTGIRDTGAKIEEMVGVSFADLGSAFSTGMELVQGNVFENGVNMLLDDLQSQIEEQLNALIDQLLEQVVSTLGNVRESLFGNAEEAGLQRKATEEVLDVLKNILDPLFSAVDHIKGMASMVGIDV